MSKHQERTLMHFANETHYELSELYEVVEKKLNAIQKEIKRARNIQSRMTRYSIVLQGLLDDELYYKYRLADISLLMTVAQKLTGKLERGEINNAILLTGDEVDKELPELPELPNGYMNPDEREQQQQDFQELP